MITNIDIYKKIIKKYGIYKQIDIAIEECLELSHELLKYKRGKDNNRNIIEEIVDTEIMIKQLKTFFINNNEMYEDYVNMINKKHQRIQHLINKK